MEQDAKPNYKEVRSKAETFYNEVGDFVCPALAGRVHFTSKGFHHLRYDGSGKERKKSVQATKFQQLKNAVDILKKSTTIQEYRRTLIPTGAKNQNGFRKTSLVEWFAFFAITSFSKMYRVKVVVRRIGGEDGKYHFWSVIPHWTLTNNTRHIGSKNIEDE